MLKLKLLLAALCACCLLTACGGETTEETPAPDGAEEPVTAEIYAMDTKMDLSVFGGDKALLNDAEERVRELEGLLSTTDAHSEIYRLNREKTLSGLSEDTAFLLDRALSLCEETEGDLDISIYPVVRAWGFTTDEYRVPEQDELDALLTHVDYRQVERSADGRDVTLPAEMMIDLGSVAKGYTGDCLHSLFVENGITSALMNLGGNVHTVGAKPDGSPWRVGIKDPAGADYLGVLSVVDRAVVTSGGYERFFEGDDGTIYWHIIDPATGRPARNGLVSATIVGAEGTRCDALSTAMFIKGPEEAEAFWRAHQDVDMVLVTEDDEVLITEGIAQDFQLVEGSPYTLRVLES